MSGTSVFPLSVLKPSHLVLSTKALKQHHGSPLMSPMPAPKANLTTSYALSGFGSPSGQDEIVLLELKYLLSARHTFQIDEESDLPTFPFVGTPILYKVIGFQETFKNFTFFMTPNTQRNVSGTDPSFSKFTREQSLY